MIDIKELAEKHVSEVSYNCVLQEVYEFTKEQLQAFADEYLALSSSGPVAWVTHSTSDYFGKVEAETSGTFRYGQHKNANIPLFLANPINQQLQTERDECVEEIRRLRDRISRISEINYKLLQDKSLSQISHISDEALASPTNILKLLEA